MSKKFKWSPELLLLEEQTMLSRERTMQQYVSTGLSFIAVGLVVAQVFKGPHYLWFGFVLITIGFWQMWIAWMRFNKYRKQARKIRKKERDYGFEIGE